MKRVSISLHEIGTFDNLVRAVHLAARGKRSRHDVRRFFARFDHHLNQLARDIQAARTPYGRFRRFTIRDPKPRTIHAACFEDLVFHHAVMHLAGPVLERSLVPSTFACRKNLGHHAAILQVQRHLCRFPWYVKIDVQHYFHTIDHDCLYRLLQRRFKGEDFLALLRRIIDGFEITPGKGVPIGALTSQHFANYCCRPDRCLGAAARLRCGACHHLARRLSLLAPAESATPSGTGCVGAVEPALVRIAAQHLPMSLGSPL